MNKGSRGRRSSLAVGVEQGVEIGGNEAMESSEREREVAPRPHRCRSYTRKKLAGAMPQIVARFVKEAEAGSVPHTNFLAAFGGFDRRPEEAGAPGARKQKGKSVARMLLDEVEAYEARNSITPVTSVDRPVNPAGER